jgi:hypothetical protein
MGEAPKRRWFRFAYSLRSLFVVVTVFATLIAWVFWNLNWIGERHSFRHGGSLQGPVGDSVEGPIDPFTGAHVGAPSTLWIFGEEGASIVFLAAVSSHEEMEHHPDFNRAKRLFPEARILPGLVPATQ